MDLWAEDETAEESDPYFLSCRGGEVHAWWFWFQGSQTKDFTYLDGKHGRGREFERHITRERRTSVSCLAGDREHVGVGLDKKKRCRSF